MRKLAEARELAKKLDAEYEYTRNYEAFVDKYHDDRRESNGFLNVFMLERHPESKLIDSKLYSHMLRAAFKKDDQEKKTDHDRLYYLITKYQNQWWD